MSTVALELADAGLLALPEEGEAPAPSPGLALVVDDRIIVGREAAARARLTPRRAHNRFWVDISTETLGRPFGRQLRAADLAWNHLAEVWSEVGRGAESAILVVSGGRSADQLGLILGVARSAGLPVDGMVDAAVAGSVGWIDRGPAIHLDIELHRAVLTVLEAGPSVTRVLTSDRVGLSALHEAWLRLAAGRFLKVTRFDPLHSAASEQALSDRLELALTELRRGNTTKLSLSAGGQVHTVELARDAFESTAQPWYREIDQLIRSAHDRRPGSIVVTARAAAMPGLVERLSGPDGIEVVELPFASAPAGALRFAEEIRSPGNALPLVTSLAPPSTPAVEP
jgi:hypothetical protein